MNIHFTEEQIEQLEDVAKAFRLMKDAFMDALSRISSCISDFVEIIGNMQIKEKAKFKPVLKIHPNKSIIKNKRLINYYCRNNC